MELSVTITPKQESWLACSKEWGELIDLLIDANDLIDVWDNDPVNVFLKSLFDKNDFVVNLQIRKIRLIEFCEEHGIDWVSQKSIDEIIGVLDTDIGFWLTPTLAEELSIPSPLQKPIHRAMMIDGYCRESGEASFKEIGSSETIVISLIDLVKTRHLQTTAWLFACTGQSTGAKVIIY